MVKVMVVIEDQKHECWVELESNKLAFAGSHTKSEKYENFAYFTELYKLIEPTQNQQRRQ